MADNIDHVSDSASDFEDSGDSGEVSMGLKIRNKMLTVTPISISVIRRAKRIKTKVRKTQKKR